MTRTLLTSAVFAGVAAGLIAAALQFIFVVPTLLEGELYESGQRIHFSTNGSPESERSTPALGGDVLRHSMTVAFNMITYVGYGLILLAFMAAAQTKGVAITARAGLIWGIAGFVTVQLAPAIGLPPELPGTPAPEVTPRQIWWFATVLATGAGLALIAFTRGVLPLAGVALMLLPHLIGAPHLDTFWGVAPPELSAHFVSLNLGTAAAGWVALGFFCGWFWERAQDEA